jgi:hypothetical protein
LAYSRKELGSRFVGLDVGTRNVGRGGDPGRRVGLLLAVSLYLAAALLAVTAQPAFGISGYSSGEPAVLAQYPDSTSLPAASPKPVFSNLGAVLKTTSKIMRNPEARTQWRVSRRSITQDTKRALTTAAGLDTTQSGSIALFIAGMAVLLVGGFLRWRRGLS